MPIDLSSVANSLLVNLAGNNYLMCHQEGGSEDPDTGKWTPGTIIETPVKGAEGEATSAMIDGINILSGDLFVTIPPMYPTPTDVALWFMVRNKRYSVVKINPTYNGDTLQVTEFQLRQS